MIKCLQDAGTLRQLFLKHFCLMNPTFIFGAKIQIIRKTRLFDSLYLMSNESANGTFWQSNFQKGGNWWVSRDSKHRKWDLKNHYQVRFTMHTIRKVKFLSKNSILTKLLTFSRVFHPIFLTFFLVKSKLSTAKKYKTKTFSRVFHPKKGSGNQSWIFGQKMKISNSVDELPVEEQSNKLIDVNF